MARATRTPWSGRRLTREDKRWEESQNRLAKERRKKEAAEQQRRLEEQKRERQKREHQIILERDEERRRQAELDAVFLPEGSWITGEKSDEGVECDNSSSISRLDSERFSFLESLDPEEVLLGRGIFGTRRVYRAFVYSRADGRKVAVVATDRTQNADYVFWASDPAWLEVAQKTKTEVRTGNYPEFLKRIIHCGAWQDSLRSLVKGWVSMAEAGSRSDDRLGNRSQAL